MKSENKGTYELILDIKNCTSEKELLKIVTYISSNSKKLNLDETDLRKLESVGMAKYEGMQRERNNMIKNKKQGFNTFNDEP